MRRKIVGTAAFAMLALTMTFASLAEEDPIDRIELEVTADIQTGRKCSILDFEFTVLSDGCEVQDAELLNTNEVWGSQDVPRVKVYLRSEDGRTFSVKRSGTRIIGAESEYGYYDENLFVYILQLRFPSLREQVGGIAEASWDSTTTAVWSPAVNAGYYEVQLYRDEKRQGSAVQTESPNYDMGKYMRLEGAYYYKVRAVDRWNAAVRSRWTDSGRVTVDSAAAESIRQKYPLPVGSGPLIDLETQPYYQDMYGWIAEGSRWWYRNADGSYTTSNWQYIDGKWYYFDSKGYMVTGWIDWNGKSYYCDPESGAMLVNMVVPDGLGLRVDSTGALIE